MTNTNQTAALAIWREALAAFGPFRVAYNPAKHQAAAAIIAKHLPAPVSDGMEPRHHLIPRLGDRVTIADHCPDSAEWNRDDWYVVGMTTELGCRGVNVHIGPEFPPVTQGATDGFWVNLWPKPDDVIWSGLPSDNALTATHIAQLEARIEKLTGALRLIEAGHGCPSALARATLNEKD